LQNITINNFTSLLLYKNIINQARTSAIFDIKKKYGIFKTMCLT